MNLEDKLEFVSMKERTIPGRGSNVLQIYFEAWGRAAASAKRGRLWSTHLCPVSDWWRGQRPGPLPHPAPHLPELPRGLAEVAVAMAAQLRLSLCPVLLPSLLYTPVTSAHTSSSQSLSREPGLRQWDMIQEQQSWCSPCHVQVESPPYWLCNCSYVLSLRFLPIKWGLQY